MKKTVKDFVSHCTDNVLIELWSTSLSASTPSYILRVEDLKRDYSDLLALNYIDYRIGATSASLWVYEL